MYANCPPHLKMHTLPPTAILQSNRGGAWTHLVHSTEHEKHNEEEHSGDLNIYW